MIPTIGEIFQPKSLDFRKTMILSDFLWAGLRWRTRPECLKISDKMPELSEIFTPIAEI
jgi:hypothetical protein